MKRKVIVPNKILLTEKLNQKQIIPMQRRPSDETSNPTGHSHLKLPGALVHLPPIQNPCLHSSTSA